MPSVKKSTARKSSAAPKAAPKAAEKPAEKQVVEKVSLRVRILQMLAKEGELPRSALRHLGTAVGRVGRAEQRLETPLFERFRPEGSRELAYRLTEAGRKEYGPKKAAPKKAAPRKRKAAAK